MKQYSIIIQGEGKGHYSQAMQVIQLLQKEGSLIKRVYIGKNILRPLPLYFLDSFGIPVKTFYSPNFLLNAKRDGIRVTLSILLNILIAPLYIFEACKLAFFLRFDKSEIVLDFYDPLGALASKFLRKKKQHIVISHHFYLSHPDFIHPHGMENSYFWLQLLNKFMLRSANKALALSYRKGIDFRKIQVRPPLIDERIKSSIPEAGTRDLCYFLNPGLVPDILAYYQSHPELEADIFLSTNTAYELPKNVILHKASRISFIEKLIHCRRVICTAGFDLIAEAFYLGKAVFLIPSVNHYEQYCNALDASRTGMAFQLESLSDLEAIEFEARSNEKFKEWVDQESFNLQY